jgi:6,7-dimethyl-8-ribityllumazine synthase
VTRREGGFDARGRRFAVVVSRFNELVTSKLLDEDVEVVWVPGAFELPLVSKRLAASGEVEAVVCLGAIIRGETTHFELVATEAARGVADAAMRTGVPCVFGVLTTEDLGQALDRAGGKHGNKGWDAALAAMEMASLMDGLPKEAER